MPLSFRALGPNANQFDYYCSPYLGRITAQQNSAATWVSGFPTLGQGFPCPAGQTHGGELVGVGNVNFIK